MSNSIKYTVKEILKCPNIITSECNEKIKLFVLFKNGKAILFRKKIGEQEEEIPVLLYDFEVMDAVDIGSSAKEFINNCLFQAVIDIDEGELDKVIEFLKKRWVYNLSSGEQKPVNEMSDQERFHAFSKELAELSLKYGISIKSIGGVEIFAPNELVNIKYSCDSSSGDLIPTIK